MLVSEHQRPTASQQRVEHPISSIVSSAPHAPMSNGLGIFLPVGPGKDGSRLAVVLDLFSGGVGGWAMAASQEETLGERAVRMALLGRHPQAGFLLQSEQGSQ